MPTIEQEIAALSEADRKALAHEIYEFAAQHLPDAAASVLEHVADLANQKSSVGSKAPAKKEPRECPRCGFPIAPGEGQFVAEGRYWVHRGCNG